MNIIALFPSYQKYIFVLYIQEWNYWVIGYMWASLVAQLVKTLPIMWETWVRSLSWEDPLEMGKATYSSILAWRIPWAV